VTGSAIVAGHQFQGDRLTLLQQRHQHRNHRPLLLARSS